MTFAKVTLRYQSTYAFSCQVLRRDWRQQVFIQ
jgi:hypothetical protein